MMLGAVFALIIVPVFIIGLSIFIFFISKGHSREQTDVDL